MAIASPQVRMKTIAPTKRPAARRKFCAKTKRKWKGEDWVSAHQSPYDVKPIALKKDDERFKKTTENR